MPALVEDVLIPCPYCGSPMIVEADCTGGDQRFYEDCQTCCSPVEIRVLVGENGDLLDLVAMRENE